MIGTRSPLPMCHMSDLVLHLADITKGWSVTVGDYEISPSRPGFTWVTHESGEGMEVPSQKLADCIAAFYKENF